LIWGGGGFLPSYDECLLSKGKRREKTYYYFLDLEKNGKILSR
jgi:hypothetical protein